jgi:ketosteroid isomerase-like protein
MSTNVEIVLQNHLAAACAGVDAIMQDYAEDSVLITQESAYHGLAEIRHFFTGLLAGLPEGVFDSFTLHRREVVGEWAYILWDAKPWVSLATDTFAIRNGRIRFQTFTANMGSSSARC